jgi:hypothetical protein
MPLIRHLPRGVFHHLDHMPTRIASRVSPALAAARQNVTGDSWNRPHCHVSHRWPGTPAGPKG